MPGTSICLYLQEAVQLTLALGNPNAMMMYVTHFLLLRSGHNPIVLVDSKLDSSISQKKIQICLTSMDVDIWIYHNVAGYVEPPCFRFQCDTDKGWMQ